MRLRGLGLLLFLGGLALVQLPEPREVRGVATWRLQGEQIALRGGLKTLERRGIGHDFMAFLMPFRQLKSF